MIDAGGARPRDDLDGLIEHLVDAERRLTVAFAKAGVDSSVLNDMRLLSNAAVALRGLRWRITALEAERDEWKTEAELRRERKIRCEELEAERDALREFVADMFEAAEWPEGGDIDGGQFQELATKHGILAEEERIAPCEGRESCWCSDYGGPGPTTCYRKAQWLAAPDKEQT